jgi:hypothetical protein
MTDVERAILASLQREVADLRRELDEARAQIEALRKRDHAPRYVPPVYR